MNTSTYSTFLIITLFVLAAIFSSCDSNVADSNSKHLIEKNELETDQTLQLNQSIESNSIENEELQMLTFSVEPTSWDFGTRCVEQLIPATFNFVVKNISGSTENGVVQILGGGGFTCTSGCNYSVAPHGTESVTIQFEPPSV